MSQGLRVTRGLRVAALALALAAYLGGCSMPGPRGAPPPGAAPAKKGGYYLDDGPGDNPPANLDAIPNVTPKAERLARGANRPYVALGKEFVPDTADRPYKVRGLASWYGRRYHGKPTSSGEIYDMYAMTAAHPTLPIPSYVRVTNLNNGRNVVVRVNDRGPFVDDRLIDLSYTAAYKLDILRGVTQVEVERLFPEDTSSSVVQVVRVEEPLIEEVKRLEPAALPIVEPAKPSRSAEPRKAGGPGTYLQVGAFASATTADDLVARIGHRIGAAVQRVEIGGLFKVHVGPFRDAESLERVAALIQDIFGIRPLKVSGARAVGS